MTTQCLAVTGGGSIGSLGDEDDAGTLKTCRAQRKHAIPLQASIAELAHAGKSRTQSLTQSPSLFDAPGTEASFGIVILIYDTQIFNPLKYSGVRQLHLAVFNAIQV